MLELFQVLREALQQARQQDKRVIVQETATWCGPCQLLAEFLDSQRELWERDYIWVKMDHRWAGVGTQFGGRRAPC